MARPRRPARNKAALSSRQLRRFRHIINSDKVFGTHTGLGTCVFHSYRQLYQHSYQRRRHLHETPANWGPEDNWRRVPPSPPLIINQSVDQIRLLGRTKRSVPKSVPKLIAVQARQSSDNSAHRSARAIPPPPNDREQLPVAHRLHPEVAR